MGYLGLLRRRPVLVLWSSAALSVLGDKLYGLAVMWVVYTATGSASLMGLAAVIESLPYILIGTFGRRIMTRFSSFGRLAWVDAGRAVLACAIPLVWTPGHGGLVLMFTLLLLLNTLGAVFDPNLGGLVPGLVEAGQVRQVTALLDLTNRLATILGPGCVGLILLAVSDVQLFALDGVTFAVSAIALWWLRSHARTTVNSATAAERVERPAAVPAGPVLRARPDITTAIGLHGVGFFVAAVSAVGLPAIVAARLGQGAAGYGMVLAAIGAGALVGNFLIGSLRVGQWLTLYCTAWAVTGAALIGISAATSLPVMIGVGVLSGLATPAAAVTLRTRLALFPQPVRLRLLTVDQTVIRTAGTAGMLILPFAVDAAPARAFAAAGGFLILAAAAAAVVGRRASATAATRALPAGEPLLITEAAASSS